MTDPKLASLLERLQKQAAQESATESIPKGLPLEERFSRMESALEALDATSTYLRAEMRVVSSQPPEFRQKAYTGKNLDKFRALLAIAALGILQKLQDCGEE